MYYKILIICILLCILFFFNSKFFIYENFNDTIINKKFNLPIDFGNVLCVYFTTIGYLFLLNKPFEYNENRDIFFVKDLPRKIDIDTNIRQQLLNNNFTIEELNNEINLTTIGGMWIILNKRREIYWNILKPLVHKILDETFIKCNVKRETNDIVVHFRCGDVPYQKHRHYHLQKYAFYKDALESVKDKVNIRNIRLVSCSNHRCGGEYIEKCGIYNNSLKEYITQLGYNVKQQCTTTLEDFSTIFYSPLVICGQSSYSFMSGFFGKGIFISDVYYAEDIDMKCNDCKYQWFNNEQYILKHIDVDDYTNTDDVISKLKG